MSQCSEEYPGPVRADKEKEEWKGLQQPAEQEVMLSHPSPCVLHLFLEQHVQKELS